MAPIFIVFKKTMENLLQDEKDKKFKTTKKTINIIEKIGEVFNLHPLLLEDVCSINQRPKVEEYENDMFIVLKMIYFDDKIKKIKVEQISLIIGENFVISFQEEPGDIFGSIRKRLNQGRVRIRSSKSDYLSYCIIDLIVDNYFLILEKIAENIEHLETEMLKDSGQDYLNNIYSLKREIILLKKSILIITAKENFHFSIL